MPHPSSSSRSTATRDGSPPSGAETIGYAHKNSSTDTLRGFEPGFPPGSEVIYHKPTRPVEPPEPEPYHNPRLAYEPYDPGATEYYDDPSRVDPMLRLDAPPPPSTSHSKSSSRSSLGHGHPSQHRSSTHRRQKSRISSGSHKYGLPHGVRYKLEPMRPADHPKTYIPPPQQGPVITRDAAFAIHRPAANTMLLMPMVQYEFYNEIVTLRESLKADQRESGNIEGPFQEAVPRSLGKNDVYRYRKQYGVNISESRLESIV